MNTKTLATIITVATLVLLATQTSLLEDVLLFILVGIIPGTTHSLSPTTMLCLVWVAAVALIISSRTLRNLAKRLTGSLRSAATTLDALLKHRFDRA